MGVFFHILSTGVGSGASRTTRYIAERDKDLTREGPGSRPLFSEDQEGLSYHKADRILEPYGGHPEKSDLIHFSVMITEEDFDKLGDDEKEKQARFREMVREGMKGMASALNVEELTWVAGIHRNTQNPHAHIVMNKDVIELGTEKPKRIARIPKQLLPYRETQNGKEVVVSGTIGDKFVEALENQQSPQRSKTKQPELTPAEIWERLARKYQRGQERADRATHARASKEPRESRQTTLREGRNRSAGTSLDLTQVTASWNPESQIPEDRSHDFRLALGKRLALEFRLAFAEIWYDRAVKHGETYRFEVTDQSIDEDRKISELDVRRRAAARASRISEGNHALRNQTMEADLASHAGTLQELAEARETKIAALGKDVGSLRSNLSKVERSLVRHYEMPGEKQLTPLEHFLESKRVASLHLGEHRTGTLREVEARTLTEYLARAILETSEQRDHRKTVKLAAQDHLGRVSSDFGKAQDYHEAARELASDAKEREPKFTEKEKISLEIYAERQNDAAERERYLEMARGESRAQALDIAIPRSR